MNESNNLPRAISHKELSFLLLKAHKDQITNLEEKDDSIIAKEALTEDMNNWELITKELLKNFSKRDNNLFQDKNPNSLMALGAMEVHLNMALQALKAFQEDNK
tara:strand:+ start:5154 stop:5465 length:312 start_codon:yes stop_codon:yes gene_type:complete